MTFEKVLDAFKAYLSEDGMYEVIMTSHGYVVLTWEEVSKSFEDIRYCPQPENLLDELLFGYQSFLQYNIALGSRDLTQTEAKEIQGKLQSMRNKCK